VAAGEEPLALLWQQQLLLELMQRHMLLPVASMHPTPRPAAALLAEHLVSCQVLPLLLLMMTIDARPTASCVHH
jgi:hypothetical protein